MQQPDIVHLTIELNELKTKLDHCMREEASFEKSKHLYLRIKEKETQLHALQWHPYQSNNEYASL